jgi:F-type H+-transporting ATPase subunit delta
LGKKEKILDRMEADLISLGNVLFQSIDFQRMITSPVYKRLDQENAILSISKRIKCSKSIQNLLSLMARKRRLFVLPNLIDDFKTLIQSERGELLAEVTTAFELTKGQTTDLGKQIELSVGKKIKLNVTIDETVLGGLIVKVGSKMIDTTVKSKLLKLQKIMKEVG